MAPHMATFSNGISIIPNEISKGLVLCNLAFTEVGFTAPLVLKQGEEGKLARDVDLCHGVPNIKRDSTPWKFNIAPENKPSQNDSNLPTIIFQGLC